MIRAKGARTNEKSSSSRPVLHREPMFIKKEITVIIRGKTLNRKKVLSEERNMKNMMKLKRVRESGSTNHLDGQGAPITYYNCNSTCIGRRCVDILNVGRHVLSGAGIHIP